MNLKADLQALRQRIVSKGFQSSMGCSIEGPRCFLGHLYDIRPTARGLTGDPLTQYLAPFISQQIGVRLDYPLDAYAESWLRQHDYSRADAIAAIDAAIAALPDEAPIVQTERELEVA